MRTAADFDSFYATSDPWGVTRANVQIANLRRHLSPIVSGQSVLDVGCGEGFLTEAILGSAKSIKGIDISRVAIDRAEARSLSNAHFEQSDFLDCSFSGYDLISALECLYYLRPEDSVDFSTRSRTSMLENYLCFPDLSSERWAEISISIINVCCAFSMLSVSHFWDFTILRFTGILSPHELFLMSSSFRLDTMQLIGYPTS